MRSFLTALVALILIHVVAVFALSGWLYATGRLSQERVDRAVGVFKLTMQEEQKQDEQAAAAERAAKELADQVKRLEEVADGPRTTGQVLAEQQKRDEIAEARVQRLQREIADLRQQLELAQAQIAKDKAELEEHRAAFEAVQERAVAERTDANFQQAVKTYEALKPRQAKQMFADLIAQGREAQVVDYLAAMQMRKAAAVLKEFKTEPEVAQATKLVEMLRARGVDALASPPPLPAAGAGGAGSGGTL